jgi:hypothetical protein
MKLKEFLSLTKTTKRKSEIIILSGGKALEAVKQNSDSLQYVDIRIFEE